MYQRIPFCLALLSLLATSMAGQTAWLYSGTSREDCENWNDDFKSQDVDMGSKTCINSQPTGNDKRRWVWVPKLSESIFQPEKYCLIMAEEDGCPEVENGCMNGTFTKTIWPSPDGPTCVELASSYNPPTTFQSFKFRVSPASGAFSALPKLSDDSAEELSTVRIALRGKTTATTKAESGTLRE